MLYGLFWGKQLCFGIYPVVPTAHLRLGQGVERYKLVGQQPGDHKALRHQHVFASQHEDLNHPETENEFV